MPKYIKLRDGTIVKVLGRSLKDRSLFLSLDSRGVLITLQKTEVKSAKKVKCFNR